MVQCSRSIPDIFDLNSLKNTFLYGSDYFSFLDSSYKDTHVMGSNRTCLNLNVMLPSTVCIIMTPEAALTTLCQPVNNVR